MLLNLHEVQRHYLLSPEEMLGVVVGAVRGVVGIEDGVVSGCCNPNDAGVGAPVETTP
jgi:hypothetical protein